MSSLESTARSGFTQYSAQIAPYKRGFWPTYSHDQTSWYRDLCPVFHVFVVMHSAHFTLSRILQRSRDSVGWQRQYF